MPDLASKENFSIMLEKLHCPEKQIEILWDDLFHLYQGKKRHYHNLSHLNAMFNEMKRFENDLNDPEILAFSIWYHDIIYNASKSNNEEMSAKKAFDILTELQVKNSRIKKCFDQIIATKSHKIHDTKNIDVMYLLDFDLEVLGRDWSEYETYSKQIRNEYSIYPWFMYKKGRKKALISFLERDHIYQTPFYRDKLEQIARDNIQKEIDFL